MSKKKIMLLIEIAIIVIIAYLLIFQSQLVAKIFTSVIYKFSTWFGKTMADSMTEVISK